MTLSNEQDRDQRVKEGCKYSTSEDVSSMVVNHEEVFAVGNKAFKHSLMMVVGLIGWGSTELL